MNFWAALRWVAGIAFVLVVLVSAFVASDSAPNSVPPPAGARSANFNL